ncbi:MAG: ABC transporter ATP-binding protein [bacterium]
MLEKLLSIKDITKHYHLKNQTIKALNGITLDIFKGEVFGLLGANGAGKTTLSSIIATLHPPTTGDILINEVSIYKDITGFRRMIGYCPQKPNLNTLLTVRQNLLFAGRYYGIPEEQIQARLEKLLTKYNLHKYADQDPAILSGGYKQRVVIARALMHNPKLVIFDEPTVGLDPHIRHQLWESIRDLKNDNISVILTTHYIDEAEILSDRICILEKGTIKLIDTPANLMSAYKKSTLEDVFLQIMHEETN